MPKTEPKVMRINEKQARFCFGEQGFCVFFIALAIPIYENSECLRHRKTLHSNPPK